MEWSNQKILTFLELLKTERPIWDPNDKHHKCKRKVDDAWRRISARLDNTPINELKTKKRSLMATFRPLLKKKIISVMSGAVSDEDVYQPIWFAYNILESFMGFIYDEWSIKMENGNEQNDETSDQDQDDTINDRNDDSPNDQEDEQTDDESRRETRKKTSSLKRYRDSIKTISNDPTNFEMDTAQKNINDSFRTLNKVLDSKKEEDDCDLYAKLLAKKLRKYPGNMRLKIMYSIDGIIIDNPYPAQQASSSSVASYSISSSSTHPLPADPLCIYQPESSDLKQNDNMNDEVCGEAWRGGVPRSPSHESVTTDLSLFSVSSAASDAKVLRLLACKAGQGPDPSTRGTSPNPDSKCLSKRPSSTLPLQAVDNCRELLAGCAALCAALGLRRSFSAGDMTGSEPAAPPLRNATSEVGVSAALAALTMSANSRSCSTWAACGGSQLPSPQRAAPQPPRLQDNKRVRQNYIKRRLFSTYRALERMSQSEFNLDKLEAAAVNAVASAVAGPGPTTLTVPQPRQPHSRFVHPEAAHLALTAADLERERGRPLSKYERNMMIFNWLHTLDEAQPF